MFEKFKAFSVAILAVLGITEYSKTKEGKSTLTDDELAQLENYSFSKEFLADYKKALENDFKDEASSGGDGKETAESEAVMKGVIAQLTVKLSEAYGERDKLAKEKGELSKEVTDKTKMISDLEGKIQILVDEPESDPGKGTQHGRKKDLEVKVDYKDEKQLGGFEGARYALDRPYNMRAKAALLYQEGVIMPVAAESSIDYQRLKEDLGDFYRVPWQQRLQSFLLTLPTLEKIFPCEYGYQDRAVLVNIWLGEFSQADNTKSDFDKVVKGNYDFDPEELRMFSVMFAHKFRNLKELEKSWIGYLNEEGSQVIKWSFIEYILFETSRKLHNERELRRINGVRKDPDLDVPGRAMEASDGLYEFLRKKISGWKKDSGTTVYQIKPFVLGMITPGNIGDIFYKGTSQIPAVVRDTGVLELHIPSILKVWYNKWLETNFGQNTDYKGALDFVKEYPNVKIVEIPNAEGHMRIFWTLKGNIKNYAHVRGEMTNFFIEQQDWTLKVWSNWKESIWAKMVGFAYTKKADMDGSRQMIWCNEYDYSPEYYIPTQKDDATPSVLLHTSIETVANTALLEITGIKDAEVNKEIRIKCGSEDFGVKITKAGVFSLLSADWVPSKGEVLILSMRADGKFIELGRESSGAGALTFAADDTTPSVAGATEFITGINTQPTAITDLTDAEARVFYTIYGNGTANASTISNGGNFVLTADMTLSTGTYIKLVKADSGQIYELERG